MENKILDESTQEEFERIYEECVCSGGMGGISSFAPEHVMGMSLSPNEYVPTGKRCKKGLKKGQSAFGGNIVDDMGGIAGKIVYAKDSKK